MGSSSRDALLKLFDDIIRWRENLEKKQRDSDKIIWTEFHLSAVRNYVSKLVLKSDDIKLLRSTMLFKLLRSTKSFTRKLKQFFVVPMLSERDTILKKNEVIGAFLDFLLQLLYDHQTYLNIDPFKDRVDSLHKELRFLLMVLGDAPFIQFLYEEELERAQINLLAEFEAVANVAGSLVYSLVFSTPKDPGFKTMDERFVLLFKHMDLLKGNVSAQILNFSDMLSPIAKSSNTTSGTSSFFIFDSLIYDLENLLNRDDSRIIGDVKDQMKALHQELILSQSLLKGVKLPPPQSEIHELKEHVTRITDVAFEAEYLINSFMAEDAPLWYISMRLPHLLHKIKFIGTELQQVKNNYDFGALKLANNFSSQLPLQASRNSEVDDIVVGFEGRFVENILDHLVGRSEQLQIIPIVGMPGLGKTTFAKKLYNHPNVTDRFDKRSWCVVSQMYQKKSLLADILISLTIQPDINKISNMEEERLAEDIYKMLKRRRFLIVMDDVWDSKTWDDLQRYFPNDENGSRILFTTRDTGVAPPTSIFYELPCLSNDQCWKLLEKKVFNNKPCPSQSLGIVGKQIAEKCHGLPLAVVVIAGIISTIDKEESAWNEVGENLSSYISCGGNNSMMQILRLSYEHLQEYLKPCFLYIGAFPEDREISAQYLMRLWIAEGFIPKCDRKRSESLAEEYLMELIDRSLVMVAKRGSTGGVKACVIHDLLRDLCLNICAEENFMKWVVDEECTIYEKSHRLVQSVAGRSDQLVQSPFGHHVRSFHYHGRKEHKQPFFVGNMKLLRVLDFTTLPLYSWSCVGWIGVEYLVNLRHLVINELPSTICSLVNLEYLKVKTEFSEITSKIPSAILKMDKLRHLHIMGRRAVFDEDCNSSQTNNIEVLSFVGIRNQKDAEILKCSPHLRKLECMCRSFYVEEKGSYQFIDLLFFTHLQSLTMYGDSLNNNEGVVEINFPSNIKKLTLWDLHLPWEKMSIIGGLPNLQLLKLGDDAFIGETWDTRDGEFQQLTFLQMCGINLKQWNVASSEHFPKLKQLVLNECQYLQEIPCEIGEIAALQSIEVEDCAETVDESGRKIYQEQRDMGNEDLKVIIIKNDVALSL